MFINIASILEAIPEVLRSKRKMSGVISIVVENEQKEEVDISFLKKKEVNLSPLISIYSLDFCEVLGFIGWVVLIIAVLISQVLVWVLFFQFVVRPETSHERVKFGGLWSIIAAITFHFRFVVRRNCGPLIGSMAEHAEIFVAASLVMVFSANSAFYLHSQNIEPLRDIGFMLVPEQDENSSWRAVSDVMTIALPIVCGLQTAFMSRENRCVVFSDFFRIATICYVLRAITTPLTSLPGPAPHCRRGSVGYLPPETWIDIVTRVGPMHGKFNTCGDLLFSGHASYTNSAMLLYLRRMDERWPRYSSLRWILGVMYLFTMSILAIAGRKHYTVDLVLGIIISTLVYFHFEHGWRPVCAQDRNAKTSEQLPFTVTQS